MRIVIATPHRKVIGGAEAYLKALIPELLKRGHEIGLACDHNSDAQDDAIDPEGYMLPAWCHEELGTQVILQRVAAFRPDIVYTQGLSSPELEAELLNTHPSVLFAHGYYGTCATGRKCHATPHYRPCARRFGPVCLLLHYPARCGGLHPITAMKRYRVEARRNVLLSRFEAVLVASRHMYNEFANHGVDPQRLRILPLPTTSCVPEVKAPAFRIPEGRILFMGRLTDLKGGAYLLRAIPMAARKLNRPLRVVVAGSGVEEQTLRELALELSVSMEFTGWLNGQRRQELVCNCDLLAVPSLWPEPFGLVGLEAACRGLPAVGYAVGGIPEWLIPGFSGELAPSDPPTENGLADAIVRALGDSEHYQDLRLGAWQMSKRFSLSAHLDGLEMVLEEVAARSVPAMQN